MNPWLWLLLASERHRGLLAEACRACCADMSWRLDRRARRRRLAAALPPRTRCA